MEGGCVRLPGMTQSTPGGPATDLPDFRPSGNQGVDPALYEIENAAMDREGALWAALQEAAPWAGRTLLDLGAGTGFWLPRYADAAETIAVEPDVRLLGAARARPGGARVLYGSAEQIPLPEASVDVVHARFAYFFPHPRWDVRPGLDEVARVLRPGGALVVIDNDTERGQFAELLRASTNAAAQGQDTYAREWWAGIGAETREVMSSWTFDSRADLEAVLRLEFERGVADAWLAEHPAATSLSYGYLLHVWR